MFIIKVLTLMLQLFFFSRNLTRINTNTQLYVSNYKNQSKNTVLI